MSRPHRLLLPVAALALATGCAGQPTAVAPGDASPAASATTGVWPPPTVRATPEPIPVSAWEPLPHDPSYENPTNALGYQVRGMADVPVVRDVHWGTGELLYDDDTRVAGDIPLLLDIFGAAPGETRPAVVLLNGLIAGEDGRHPAGHGGWGQLFAAHGWVAVDAMQMGSATPIVEWLRAHPDDYGIDPDRIAVMGFSAGSGAALHASLDPQLGVRAMVAYYPSINTDGYAAIPPEWSPFDAVQEVGPDAAPMLLVMGGTDWESMNERTAEFAAVADAAGAPVVLAEQPTGFHGFDAGYDPNTTAVIRETLVWLHDRFAG